MNCNPLYKKSALFVGDSIGHATCESNTDYADKAGYAGRILKENEMGGINKCNNGASMSDCRGTNLIINQLIAMSENDYDYVILEGGGNDAWDSMPVGVMTEGFDGPFDRNTFAGGFENTIKYAKENFKTAKIGFIVTFQMPSAPYGRLSDMSEYFALSKKICDKWEIPYIDLFFDEKLNKDVLKTHTSEFLPDFVHPNTQGYNILAPMINDWMKTL